jgi:PKD repeat protein
VASFFYTPTNPVVDQVIQFNATASNDPDGTIEKYQWDMGDGTTLYGSVVSHQYTGSGTYTVYLQVFDNSDNIGSTSQNITINDNQSPTASFVYSPTSPEINSAVHFNASDSTDPDGIITSWQWDFGDRRHGSGEEVNHTYTDAGTYTVVLVVTDDSGNTDSVSKTVTVIDGTPIAYFTVSPGNPNAGDTVTFDASGSSDPNGRIVEWEWDFDDGSAHGTTEIVTHQFTNPGVYVVTLTVTDDDDNTATASQTVTVN